MSFTQCIQSYFKCDAITFDELVEYGKQHTENIVNGMPWSFMLSRPPHYYAVTHENDSTYIIHDTRLERGQVLIIDTFGYLVAMSKEQFDKIYIKIAE